MHAFEKAWATVSSDRQGEAVSPELRPLLQSVYLDVLSQARNLSSLKLRLQELLTFLTKEGRTNANCWEKDWADQKLPDDFHDVLVLMGNTLRDSVSDPHIAENFDCLPEQLLERVNRLSP